jgi:hypothetical protein
MTDASDTSDSVYEDTRDELRNYANGLYVLAGIRILIIFTIGFPLLKVSMTTSTIGYVFITLLFTTYAVLEMLAFRNKLRRASRAQHMMRVVNRYRGLHKK